MSELTAQLNMQLEQLRFAFLIENLNEAWSALKNLVVAFFIAQTSIGTNLKTQVKKLEFL